MKGKWIIIMAAFLNACTSVSTPLIREGNGQVLPRSVASLEKIPLGGMEQWILIRGNDTINPVLLWLHGGPGAAQMPVARYFNGALEKDFIVVHWDQRGAGKSNPSDFDESTMTLQQFLSDAHNLTHYLLKRFHKNKLYLLGHSWGTILGLYLAQKYPQDYYAYIAVSQVVDSYAANEIAYRWLTDQIKAKKRKKDLRRLQALGLPPYREHESYVRFIKLVDSYGGGMDVSFGKLFWIALKAPEYSFSDYLKWYRGANRGSGPMWDSTSSFNMFHDVPELKVPVYFLSGKDDFNTPLQLVEKYFKLLKAPAGKHLIIFEHSAHTPFMKEADKFNRELARIKQKTYPIQGESNSITKNN